ncbi:FMN-binding negative transcriptional regulator [Variovorax saccharolyticus]|uniref:FMN-binding negative transcriptional regulator n=1 Tax=Variovorax saccharolyticus TaxID=3053516 RepID=UPI0025752571|nr:FMN-binding negative transcriptional regulator [Variovorax sp. J22R187]MDM0020197.1 FMN-binding negative transcriptional regulator [Variovorax sp. J22R187]
MHTQPLFELEDPKEIERLVRAYPLATLIASTSGGLEANLLPLEWSDDGERVRLRGHVARAHSMSQGCADGCRVLAVFQSPNAYISPRWYVNGQRSGRLAPSWNYAAVEARGCIRFIEDSQWLLRHLRALTAFQEAQREAPWSLEDASPSFVEEAARRLVGFEIDVEQLAGKRFLSQQRTQADRHSLIRHLSLERAGSARELASLIVP